MRLSLTLTVLLVAGVSAGCIGGGKTMTAREGLEDARSAAEGWSEGRDVALLGLVAVEPFRHIQSTDEDGEVDAEYVTHLDANPGDGNAPGWVYGFFDGERCIVVVLAAGLGVLAEGYETCSDQVEVDARDSDDADDASDGGQGHDDEADDELGEDDGPDLVRDWSVDSNEVAEILADEEDWPDLGDDGTYFWGLFPDDGKTMWVVGGVGEDGESVEAVVDADTGEVLAVEHVPAGEPEGFFGGGVPPEPEGAGEGAGSAGAPGRPGMGSDQDSDSAPALAAGGTLLAEVDLAGPGRIDLSVAANVIVGAFVLTVDGPDGRVTEEDLVGLVAGASQQGRDYEDLPPGHYTITLSSQGTALLASLEVDASW